MSADLSAAIQLDLEKALCSFAASTLADEVKTLAAHELGTPDSGDYLLVIANLPDWERFSGEAAAVPVSFQLVTLTADSATRATQTTAHQSRLGKLIQAFTQQNYL